MNLRHASATRRCLAIADDLSGAAEIAGIGFRFGLPTRLMRGAPSVETISDGLTVIDTDSRLLPAAEAAGLATRIVGAVRRMDFDFVFKKTDSALRGAIVAEVEALMDAFGHRAALLVPQNPSRGRTIERGEYRIDGVPLHQTAFANDPTHPAQTANVLELLGPSSRGAVRYLEPAEPLPNERIFVGGARDSGDVRRWAQSLASPSPGTRGEGQGEGSRGGRDTDARAPAAPNPHPALSRSTGRGESAQRRILPVGGADFFQAILESRGLRATRPVLAALSGSPRWFVCGSASRESDQLVAGADAAGAPVCAMTDDANAWHEQILAALEKADIVVACVRGPVDRSPGASRRIEAALADLVARVLAARRVAHLFLEGGATASAVCRRLGWEELEIRGELATGVVQMRAANDAGGQLLTVKPGSYLWPEAVWQ